MEFAKVVETEDADRERRETHMEVGSTDTDSTSENEGQGEQERADTEDAITRGAIKGTCSSHAVDQGSTAGEAERSKGRSRCSCSWRVRRGGAREKR